MRNYICLLFCVAAYTSNGQRVAAMVPQGEIRDALGQPLTTKHEPGVEGSPFLYDIYTTGKITAKGKVYSNLKLKLNLEKNIVFFEVDGVEMVPTDAVTHIELLDPVSNKQKLFRNGFPETAKNTNQTYYEVLDSGKVLLLKHVALVARASGQYGDASIIKRYEQRKSFYLFSKNNLVHAGKGDVILEVMNDKKSEMNSFITANKLKAGKEGDLKLIVSYYNKL